MKHHRVQSRREDKHRRWDGSEQVSHKPVEPASPAEEMAIEIASTCGQDCEAARALHDLHRARAQGRSARLAFAAGRWRVEDIRDAA